MTDEQKKKLEKMKIGIRRTLELIKNDPAMMDELMKQVNNEINEMRKRYAPKN